MPQHQVTLTKGFLIQRTEVTQSQYLYVVGSNPSTFQGASYPDADSRPVENVSWNKAEAFCRLLSQWERVADGTYGLPTEAHWEYAARAGSTDARYGLVGNIAWYNVNGANQTHPVGGKSANTWGLYDMLGNVWEWTADWSSNYSSVSQDDPSGPLTGSLRMYRGGSIAGSTSESRAASRRSIAPTSAFLNLGFRVVRSFP